MPAPIVGCPSIDHPSALNYAQRWFLVDSSGRWLTDAKLAAVDLSMSHGNLVIRAPEMLRIDLPLDVIEDDESVQTQVLVGEQPVLVVDEGDLAAVWFSNLLEKPCRLVKVHPDSATPNYLSAS